MGFNPIDFLFGNNESTSSVDLRNLSPQEQEYLNEIFGNMMSTLGNLNPEQRAAKVKEIEEALFTQLSGDIDRGFRRQGSVEDAAMTRRGLLSSSEQAAARRGREGGAARAKGDARLTARLTGEDIGFRDASLNLQTAGGLGSLLNSLNQWQYATSTQRQTHPTQGLVSDAAGFVGYGLTRPGGWLEGLFNKPAGQGQGQLQ